jgi:DNA-binding SARP family transcriptional activator
MGAQIGQQMSVGMTMERRHAAEEEARAAAPGLTIRLLGGFAILRGCVPLSGPWRTEKARSLVKLLALAPDHALHRDQVLEWLWPERDPAASANNLHFALHAARRILDGPER